LAKIAKIDSPETYFKNIRPPGLGIRVINPKPKADFGSNWRLPSANNYLPDRRYLNWNRPDERSKTIVAN